LVSTCAADKMPEFIANHNDLIVFHIKPSEGETLSEW
jgi:hypothetical protein